MFWGGASAIPRAMQTDFVACRSQPVMQRQQVSKRAISHEGDLKLDNRHDLGDFFMV
jgi:hypothetical protein